MTRDPLEKYALAFRPIPGAPPPVSLTDLRPHCCKWPVGENPTLFCGCTTTTGRYCPDHEKMSGIRLAALA